MPRNNNRSRRPRGANAPRRRRVGRARRRPNSNRGLNGGSSFSSGITAIQRPVVMRMPPLFPDRVITTLTYSDRYTITASSGAIATDISAGNSLFDVDITGTGHQPYGYDQWAGIYSRYISMGSTMKIAVATTASTIATSTLDVSLFPSVTPSLTFSDINRVHDQPYCKYRVLQLYSDKNTIVSSAKTSTMYGKSPSAVKGEIGYSALINAGPIYPWFWYIVVQALDASSSVVAIVDVQINFQVEFSERQYLVES